ncbi:hypothetical protein BD779DRAFT_97126 [Infundibulicybe gibba]|nr:hypothetical protein BD779DRAFT_97126 [Infundibulicybe gibba]
MYLLTHGAGSSAARDRNKICFRFKRSWRWIASFHFSTTSFEFVFAFLSFFMSSSAASSAAATTGTTSSQPVTSTRLSSSSPPSTTIITSATSSRIIAPSSLSQSFTQSSTSMLPSSSSHPSASSAPTPSKDGPNIALIAGATAGGLAVLFLLLVFVILPCIRDRRRKAQSRWEPVSVDAFLGAPKSGSEFGSSRPLLRETHQPFPGDAEMGYYDPYQPQHKAPAGAALESGGEPAWKRWSRESDVQGMPVPEAQRHRESMQHFPSPGPLSLSYLEPLPTPQVPLPQIQPLVISRNNPTVDKEHISPPYTPMPSRLSIPGLPPPLPLEKHIPQPPQVSPPPVYPAPNLASTSAPAPVSVPLRSDTGHATIRSASSDSLYSQASAYPNTSYPSPPVPPIPQRFSLVNVPQPTRYSLVDPGPQVDRSTTVVVGQLLKARAQGAPEPLSRGVSHIERGGSIRTVLS